MKKSAWKLKKPALETQCMVRAWRWCYTVYIGAALAYFVQTDTEKYIDKHTRTQNVRFYAIYTLYAFSFNIAVLTKKAEKVEERKKNVLLPFHRIECSILLNFSALRSVLCLHTLCVCCCCFFHVSSCFVFESIQLNAKLVYMHARSDFLLEKKNKVSPEDTKTEYMRAQCVRTLNKLHSTTRSCSFSGFLFSSSFSCV